MPICTSCTYQLPYLYTVYESAHNLRLEQCPKCFNFADPYVEHDPLIILLDLILLKRGVFRHLLFNRGFEPHHASKTSDPSNKRSQTEEKQRMAKLLARREKERWSLILRLGVVLVFVDAFIRWSHLASGYSADRAAHSELWTKERTEPLLRIFVGCIIETVAFHTGITATSALFLKLTRAWTRRAPESEHPSVSVSEELRVTHVPLTILYSSLTKLFLLLLLALWKPSTSPINGPWPAAQAGDGVIKRFFAHETTQTWLEFLDDDKLDREWIVRNVLGGMAAGFGLRVVLDIHPAFTTLVILVGWAVKTSVASAVSSWVNKGHNGSDVFLAYSIP